MTQQSLFQTVALDDPNLAVLFGEVTDPETGKKHVKVFYDLDAVVAQFTPTLLVARMQARDEREVGFVAGGVEILAALADNADTLRGQYQTRPDVEVTVEDFR